MYIVNTWFILDIPMAKILLDPDIVCVPKPLKARRKKLKHKRHAKNLPDIMILANPEKLTPAENKENKENKEHCDYCLVSFAT